MTALISPTQIRQSRLGRAGLLSPRGLVAGVASAVLRPRPLVREAVRLTGEVAGIVRGAPAPAPAPRDKRFADPAWTTNPLYRRWGQGYVALGDALQRLVDDLDDGERDWHEVERARFAVTALVGALAPTNTLIGNPAALKRAFDTAGASVARGAATMLHDLRKNGGMPAQTDRTAFSVGADLAVTPGSVVHRSEVVELIRYAPTTSTVKTRPLVVIPPPIGRYYFLDLRPGRSFVEWAVGQGFQVFLLSWRNPGPDQAGWDIDTYAGAAVEALDVVKELTGSPDVNTIGFCAGGILQSALLSCDAAEATPSIHSSAFGVTLLDFAERAPLGAFSSARLLGVAGAASRRKGVITARSLGTVFSWMRPDDLVFSGVVNNWLMGEPPPVFDILAWNADGTNLPATLHQEFLEVFRSNALCTPGAVRVLGRPVDLGTVQVPVFVTGAVNDHLTPWAGCFRTTELLSGPSTFVLSNAGHIASLVNPPGNPKAVYYEGGATGNGAQGWRDTAVQRTGSWWQAWAAWALPLSGQDRPAPTDLGSGAYPELEAAPGRYVLDLPG